MIHIKDPAQINLFDLESSFLTELAQKRLETSFYAVFRHVILSSLPAQEIGKHFSTETGRRTKELYSMAGLLLLKEFRNWTTSKATEAYLFDYRVQYALNTGRDNISFCERTLERYMVIMREDKLAEQIFDTVTAKLIEELGIEISSQRLDSTHVFSDMATFARTKLMGVAIKRFLIQVKRHHSTTYQTIDPEILTRYEKKETALFADHSKNKEKRSHLRQEVAEQMHQLITFFTGNEKIENMTSYKHLVQIFNEQCEIISPIDIEQRPTESTPPASTDPSSEDIEGIEKEPTTESATTTPATPAEVEIKVKKKTGGNIIQNPSDPEATYCGHKGVGYQVQICETTDKENEVQLITSVEPQTAVESDANAIEIMTDKLAEADLNPVELLADTLYGSDENYLTSKAKDIELISPVSGPAPKTPAKKTPAKKPTAKQNRLSQRREQQETEEWKNKYNIRSQIEGTIGSIKRLTGMVRLRYRGEKSVFSSITLKLTGWNISRSQSAPKMQQKLKKIISQRRNIAQEGVSLRILRIFSASQLSSPIFDLQKQAMAA